MITIHVYTNLIKKINKKKVFTKNTCRLGYFVITILALMSSPSFADDTDNSSKLSLGFGFASGGDTLYSAELVFKDRETVSDTVKAGGGLHLWAGGLFPMSRSTYALVTLGYKFDDITASDGKVEFSRMTLDAASYLQFEKVRLGLGTTYHFDVEYSESGAAGNNTAQFDDSLGYIFSATFPMGQRSFIELRRTIIEYTVSSVNGISVANEVTMDGNSWGLYVSSNY